MERKRTECLPHCPPAMVMRPLSSSLHLSIVRQAWTITTVAREDEAGSAVDIAADEHPDPAATLPNLFTQTQESSFSNLMK